MNLASRLRDGALTLGLFAAVLIIVVLDRPNKSDLRRPENDTSLLDSSTNVEPRKPADDARPLDGRKEVELRKETDGIGSLEVSKTDVVDVKKTVIGHLVAPNSIYAKRTTGNRGEWIEKVGGTQRSEEIVQQGLEWLARHQAEDGSWSPSCLGIGVLSRCERDSKCTIPGQDFAYAQTGLAVLALQAGGHFHFQQSAYSEHVRNGLNWMIEHQKENGELFLKPSPQYMYEHGIATFALAEAVAVEKADGRRSEGAHREALEKAIAYLLAQQHSDGGWRYDGRPRTLSDTSVSGWQMLAIKTAVEAGLEIPQERLDRLAKYFLKCEMGVNGRTGYFGRRHQISEATTGVGMLVHQFLLKTPDSPLVVEAAPYLAEFLEKSPAANRSDYYLLYNCTLAMFQAGGEPWARWNPIVRELLIDKQVTIGCERGSWPTSGMHDFTGGRIYTTALATLTLEVYYRFSKSQKE